VGHYRSEWKWAYERYREIERSVRAEDQIALSAVFFPKHADLDLLATELTKAGRKSPRRAILRDIKKLQGLYATASKVAELFDDVYHAAFAMVRLDPLFGPNEVIQQLDQITRLYRGQRRDCWQVIPSLFRPERGKASPCTEEIISRIRRAHGFATLLKERYQERYPSLSYSDAMAIAQHYSQEARLGTWLIDGTFDPWIALFFASWGGQEDDTGLVEWIYVSEWGDLSAGGKNPLGAVHLYKPTNANVPRLEVQRIEAQRALFVEAPHPLLWEQYVPFRLRFRQREGLLFEDSKLGVTRSALFPTSDPLTAVAEEFGNTRTDYPEPDASTLPQNLFVDPLSGRTYLEMVRSWLPERAARWDVDPLPGPSFLALRAACEFHARLQAPHRQDKLMRDRRSLNRLSDAVDKVLSGIGAEEARGWDDILRDVYSRVYRVRAVTDEERDAMASALREVEDLILNE
jgi:FRG domain